MKNIDTRAWGICLLRISVSFLMIYGHGWEKLMKFIYGNPIEFANPLGIGVTFSFMLIILAEFFCALFIMLGLLTRLSTLPVIIAMMVAAFIYHGNDPFEKKELALVYLLIYLTLFFTGPGAFSLQKGLGIQFSSSGKIRKFLLQ